MKQEERKEEQPKEDINEKKNKKGFFKKIGYAITKIEKYPEMAIEGIGKAVAYLAKLVIIISVILSVWLTYQTYTELNNGLDYIKNEFPSFSYKEGKLSVENNQEPLIFEREDIEKIIIDTETDSQEEINSYLNSINKNSGGIVVTKDKLIIKNSVTDGAIEYNYTDILGASGIQEFSKEDVVNLKNNANMSILVVNVFLTLFVYGFIMYFITTLSYVLLISVLGFFATSMLKMKMRYAPIFNMSIYAITLSVILNIIYLVVNIFTGFVIEYFQVMYIAVATIYLIAAIMIMKSEFIKKQAELMKIVEAQKIVKKELENNKEEKKEEKKEERGDTKEKKEDQEGNKEKKDKNGEEPEGQNA